MGLVGLVTCARLEVLQDNNKKRVLAEWIKAGNKRTAENQEQSECTNERLYLSVA